MANEAVEKFTEYLLKYKAGTHSAGAYVGIDNASGGYPYPTANYRSAAPMTEERARRYTEMFPELEMFAATVIVYLDKK